MANLENIKKLREITGAGMMDIKKALDNSNDDLDSAIEWLRKNGIAKAAKKADRIAAEGSIFISANSEQIVIFELNSETDFVASNADFKATGQKILTAILNANLTDIDLESTLNLIIDKYSINDLLIALSSKLGEKISLRRINSFKLNSELQAGYYLHSNHKIGSLVLGKNLRPDLIRDLAMHVTAMAPTYLSLDSVSDDVRDKEFEIAIDLLKDSLEGKPENIKKNIILGKVNKSLATDTLMEQDFIKDNSKKIKDLLNKGEIISFVRFEVGQGIEKKNADFRDEVNQQIANSQNK